MSLYLSCSPGYVKNKALFRKKYIVLLIDFPLFFSSLDIHAAAHFDPGQLIGKGGESIENEKEGRLERACQTAGSEVLGNDAGC